MVKYMAIDCEMVETIGVRNSLARVSIVDQNSQVVLDEFVIPPGGYVVDYRTRYSGITKEIIDQKGQGTFFTPF
jgi:RNA exonuclease 1